MDIGLTLLAQASLPLKFWWNAFHTAVFLINRLPTPTLNNISPYQKIFHKKPDYNFLRTFGCACYPYLRPYNRHKLEFRSGRCVFIGYSSQHKGYQCLHSSGRVYISNHVIFDENSFPYVPGSDFSSVTQSCNSNDTVSHSSTISTPIFTHFPALQSPLQSSSASGSSEFSTTIPSQVNSPYSSSHTPQMSDIQPLNDTQSLPHIIPAAPPIGHSMITRSKAGIFKPKSYLAALLATPSEPTSVSQAITDPKWFQAMHEYQALQNNHTWVLVQPSTPVKVIGSKWVFRIKYNSDGTISRYKARLVAKGFHQTHGIDYTETYSPVVKASTVRIVLSLAVMNKWILRQVDVNNAFLNDFLVEDVYMVQPEGFVDPTKPTHVCKLKKAIYGLKQAPRAWFDRFKNAMVDQWGFLNSKSDSSLFYKWENNHILLVLVYVDDIIVTGSNYQLVQQVIHNMQTTFALKDLGELNYFLGIEVSKTAAGVHLSQAKYIADLLAKHDMASCSPVPTPMSTGHHLTKSSGSPISNASQYRSIIGALQYVTLTRPEIAFSVNKLSQFLSLPMTEHWEACKRLLRYLKGSIHFGLHFYHCGTLQVNCYSDSDWACDKDDRKSVAGYAVYLGSNVVSWCSKKQQVVSRSSTEAEYRALAQATSEVVWIENLLSELKIKLVTEPIMWCDNQGAIALAYNPVYHAKTKHVELDIHFIREKIAAKKIEVQFVPSEDQTADILTKPLTFDRFHYLRSKLNVHPGQFSLRGDVTEHGQSCEDEHT